MALRTKYTNAENIIINTLDERLPRLRLKNLNAKEVALIITADLKIGET
ncbi:MAG: hypothetical protein IKV20_04445 [Clostridia bacterium]|nr:hypothetical protein [Clostridia bacterium]